MSDFLINGYKEAIKSMGSFRPKERLKPRICNTIQIDETKSIIIAGGYYKFIVFYVRTDHDQIRIATYCNGEYFDMIFSTHFIERFLQRYKGKTSKHLKIQLLIREILPAIDPVDYVVVSEREGTRKIQSHSGICVTRLIKRKNVNTVMFITYMQRKSGKVNPPMRIFNDLNLLLNL